MPTENFSAGYQQGKGHLPDSRQTVPRILQRLVVTGWLDISTGNDTEGGIYSFLI
ncbi:hypothetical protein [Dickeya zeae]|uniref:hypothetical protein n=1 Tax=Dickeya zeae TaxID=204042 RepID=UPI0003A8A01D|nr:hypothetical protein [Dickeya zeae]